jgi:hypothetical protein
VTSKCGSPAWSPASIRSIWHGDTQQAVALYQEAAELTRNLTERRYLEQRANTLIGDSQT